jgi:hypothetical protein
MRFLYALVLLPALVLGGCRSAFVTAVVENRTSEPVQLLEVSYPSASFGTQSIAPGADFRYRFKVLGEGKMSLSFTDAQHQEHKSEGPLLKEGAEGPITITILANDVHWQNNTHMR